MKAFLIENGTSIAIGVAIGWVLFKRPEWIESIIAKIKAKF